MQIEHIHPRSKGGSNKISNLALACVKCNQKKGNQDIKVFLAKKSEELKKILAQAKAPLKDAAAQDSTRGDLLRTLKATNLPITTGSGGLTKFNRTRLQLPKTHHFDAACVGETPSLEVLTNKPLIIKATGHGNRQMCGTDKYGLPNRHRTREKSFFGFQTGDIVRASLPTGKFAGTHTGRLEVLRYRGF